jgi:cilia- and flagella-associated protein 52
LDLEVLNHNKGNVPNGYIQHPDGQTKIYSLGSTIVICNKKQEFLQGHTNVISCIAISKCGKYIASGQQTHMGFQADIIVWDFHSLLMIKKLSLHKVKVQALAFSPSGKYLTSLGGEDDNSVIVWDMSTYAAICGSPASADSSGVTLSLAYFNKSETQFVTGGIGSLRVWELYPEKRKIRATDCQTGQIKRIVKCICVDKNDEFMYCGTTTGDLLQVSLQSKLFKKAGPPKEKENFSMGILTTAISPNGELVAIGSGDGTIAILSLPKLNILSKTNVRGSVTSITFDSNGENIIAGTAHSNIYSLQVKELKPVLKSSSHYSVVNDVCFPSDSSDIFATASNADIRIWNATNNTELLRISVPNIECKCIIFKKDGSSLITGWNDGKIRAFGPQTGRLQYVINDAHKPIVTALAVTDAHNNKGDFRIVSGGEGFT